MRPRDFFERHPLFTHGEFVSEHTSTGRSIHTSNTLLRKHLAAGRILRVRRGLYATVPRAVNPEKALVDPYLIATKLTDDAVVAYHGALQFHGTTYSVSRRFHYLTRHRARPFAFQGSEFIPVRALVDVFDSPDKGGGWEEIWRSLELVSFFDLDAVIDYTQKLGSAITAARVGFFLEQHREQLMAEDAHLEKLEVLGPKAPRYFDPKRQSGKLIPDWNLIVSEQVLFRRWEEVL